jgi:hypothetical protein
MRNMAESIPIEAVLAGSKPPRRPKVSGYIALFCVPIAGALVAAASFRNMGLPRKAQQTMSYTLLLCIAFLVPFIFAIPPSAAIKKLILVAVEGAGYSVFPSLLREDYVAWRRANPDTKARNDYSSIGCGLLGLLMYATMAALLMAFRK